MKQEDFKVREDELIVFSTSNGFCSCRSTFPPLQGIFYITNERLVFTSHSKLNEFLLLNALGIGKFLVKPKRIRWDTEIKDIKSINYYRYYFWKIYRIKINKEYKSLKGVFIFTKKGEKELINFAVRNRLTIEYFPNKKLSIDKLSIMIPMLAIGFVMIFFFILILIS